MTPDEYCAIRVGGSGASLYYSLLFVPPAARHDVNALYAFAHELREIADEYRDPGVAHAKLDWWREELLRVYAATPRHPVTRALAPVIATHGFERVQFLTQIDTAQSALGRVRIENGESLPLRCHHPGPIPSLLTAVVLGITDPSTRAYAQVLGTALQMTEVIAHLGRDARRDRCYLASADLRRFGVAEADLFACRHSNNLEELVKFEIERTLQYFERALVLLSPADRDRQLPGIIFSNIACAQLHEIQRDGYRVLERHLTLPPLRKFWIAWKTRFRER